MAEPETNLRTLFAKAQTLSQTLTTLSPTDAEYAPTVSAALTTLASCQHAANQISLFSPNEILDDLASNTIQYLSIPYHIAELTQKDLGRDRADALRAAQSSYDEFLSLQRSYGTLSEPDRKDYARWAADRDGFSVVSVADPGKRREAKIARLMAEKAVRKKLEGLRLDPAALEGDEDALRALRLAELGLQTAGALQALDFIAQELRILAMAPSEEPGPDPRQLEADYRERGTGRAGGLGDGYSERLDGRSSGGLRNARGGPILDARGRPMQPFVLMGQRQQLREGVFRQGHRLPTMSIDEYLEEERRRGGIIEGGGESVEVEPDEDDLEKADAETMKKREWDEFVEENPKGAGNTINRG